MSKGLKIGMGIFLVVLIIAMAFLAWLKEWSKGQTMDGDGMIYDFRGYLLDGEWTGYGAAAPAKLKFIGKERMEYEDTVIGKGICAYSVEETGGIPDDETREIFPEGRDIIWAKAELHWESDGETKVLVLELIPADGSAVSGCFVRTDAIHDLSESFKAELESR